MQEGDFCVVVSRCVAVSLEGHGFFLLGSSLDPCWERCDGCVDAGINKLVQMNAVSLDEHGQSMDTEEVWKHDDMKK